MTERQPGSREPAPQENIFDEELKSFKRARLEGRINSEQLQRIKEALAVPDLKKLQKLRLTGDITSEELHQLKEKLELKKGGAGAEEATEARATPEPVAPEATGKTWEEERRAAEIKPEERAEIFKAFREATAGWKDRMRELKIPGKEFLKSFGTKELVKTLEGKRIFGRTALELLISAGAGGGIRTTLRYGLGALTGGWGYILASTTGAVSAGLVEGTIAHHKELKRQKELKDEEFEHFLLEVREKKKKLTEKIDLYLEYARAKDEAAEEVSEDKKELRKFLENKFARSAFWRGAGKGAMVGAIGGFAGAYLSDLVTTKLGWKIPGAEEAGKAAKDLKNPALVETMAAASADAFNKTHEKAIRAGLAGLDARDFTALTRKGEGATHLARKWIADYISQHQALGDTDFKFNKAQLVYAEDWLQKYQFTNRSVAPRLGEIFKIRGDVIRAALDDARGLSPAEIDNLNKNWVGKISEKTWGSIFNYKNVYNVENDFTTEIFDEAKRKSAAAGKRAAEELGRAAARPPSPQAAEAAGSWFRASIWGLGAAGLGLGTLATYKYWGSIRAGAERGGRAIARGARKSGSVLLEGLEEFGRTETPLAGAPEPPVIKESDSAEPPEAAEAGEQKPSPVIDIAAQRRAEEERQRAEAELLETARTEQERVEHEKKLAADPMRKYLREGGISIEPEDDFHYEIPSKESIAARKGPSMRFDNYPDFRQYLEGLTLEERVIAERFTTTIGQGKNEKKYPTIGIWARPSFWNKLKALPELNKRFLALQERALKGLLADEYSGLPAKEDPQHVIEPLIYELRAKFKDKSFTFYRRNGKEIPLEEEVEGLQKLSRALERIVIHGEWSRYLFGFMIGKKGAHIDEGGNLLMEIDPALSESEMGEYILGAIPKIDEFGALIKYNRHERRAIKEEYGLDVAPPNYEKISLTEEIASLRSLRAVLSEVLKNLLPETNTLMKEKVVLQIGVVQEPEKDTYGHINVFIPPGLSTDETYNYLMEVAEKVRVLSSTEQ